MSTAVVLVFANAPDAETAQQLAQQAVEQKLAACVTLLPPAQSVYRWQGRVESALEYPLLLKTQVAALPALQAWWQVVHVHEVPEFLVLPISAGLPSYLQWVVDNTLECA